MAATTTKTGAAPRKRTATKAAPATPPAEGATAEVEVNVFDCEHQGDTKSYSKWAPPENVGCVGNIYAPLGTTAVRVKVETPAS